MLLDDEELDDDSLDDEELDEDESPPLRTHLTFLKVALRL